MNAAEIRRPLEEMIGELVDGLLTLPALDRSGGTSAALSLTSLELRLPVETRLLQGPAGLVVHADLPALRTRTAFDLPVSQFVLRLSATGTEGAP